MGGGFGGRLDTNATCFADLELVEPSRILIHSKLHGSPVTFRNFTMRYMQNQLATGKSM